MTLSESPRGCNVLITSSAAKVPLIQAFRKAQGDGGKVFSADITADCASAHFSDGHFVVLPAKSAGSTAQLVQICLENDVGIVVPTRDGELQGLAAARDLFSASGIYVHVASTETLELCLNKRRFGEVLAKYGFPSVPIIDALGGKTVFPVFVRPASGSAGRGARRVENPEDLAALLDSGDFLVHPCIDAPEYSIDLLMDLDGSSAIDAVCRERIQVVAGESKISRVVDLPELITLVMRMGESIGLVGHNTVQAFVDPRRGPLIIEANARFGGASNLSIQAGLDSPRRILQMLKGEQAAYGRREIAIGATMFRYAQDIIVGADR
jgi:carbamoyl-phosphate synthase large subunit